MKKVLILGGFLALITLIVAVLFLTQPYSPAVTVSAQ
jgi:hypothetical protein